MDELVLNVLKVKFLGRCSDVARVVPVALYEAIDRGDEKIVPDVKLSIVV